MDLGDYVSCIQHIYLGIHIVKRDQNLCGSREFVYYARTQEHLEAYREQYGEKYQEHYQPQLDWENERIRSLDEFIISNYDTLNHLADDTKHFFTQEEFLREYTPRLMNEASNGCRLNGYKKLFNGFGWMALADAISLLIAIGFYNKRKEKDRECSSTEKMM